MTFQPLRFQVLSIDLIHFSPGYFDPIPENLSSILQSTKIHVQKNANRNTHKKWDAILSAFLNRVHSLVHSLIYSDILQKYNALVIQIFSSPVPNVIPEQKKLWWIKL